MITTLRAQNIDYTIPVDGSMLDYDSYESKFDLWERINRDLEEEPESQELIDANGSNLWDFTYWVYSFMREIEDNEKRFKVTAYQDAIAHCALQHDFTFDNPNRFILYRASNQAGKSALLQLLAIYICLTKTNKNVVIVSNNLKNSQFLIAQMRQLLNNSAFADSWQETLGDTANTTHLTFKRDIFRDGKKIGESLNRIICVPAGEGALGYPVHYMFLDEADFYDDAKNFFWKVAFPRTNKTKGQIILFSNPNPDISRTASLLWELWHGSLFQRKFHFNFLDAPWNTKADLEIARANSPSYIFESTHLGEFPIDSGGFFTQTELDDMFSRNTLNAMPIVSKPIYIGLDLAKVKDNTVLSIGTLEPCINNPSQSELYIHYLKKYPIKTDYDVIVEDLKKIVDHYKEHGEGVARLGFDATGVGKAIGDFIRQKGIAAMDVKFSQQNKSRMYANFKLLAEQRRIHVCDCPEAKQQLSTLVFKRTPSGYLSVAHEKESMHDDFPDSICALLDVSIMPSRVPVTLKVIGRKEEEDLKPDPSTDKHINEYISRTIRSNNSFKKVRNPYENY